MGRSGSGEAAAGGREFGAMDEFWGFYLSQHSKPATRRWHFLGTLASLVCVVLAAATGRAALLLAAPVVGYGMAWYSHFFVEGNRPASFGHPVWSFVCDYRMFMLILTGGIDAELARFGVTDAASASSHRD
ncbi:hypothetical protein PR202_gb19340 [Eleusine coracana subsp. coracana]|uniref:Transmembrane protein n=1 Tax=Eleusine coracana subsp. coracana TaxID=191504 RepID=A0AAV5F5R2_ELECO|nr:hypothetical protein QOZ80_3BG0285900 [Eleusine coracana subsp. coracana]GJN30989.1 hypothetical protein PR202_gb19340 [Eleusine coracana subsp. coracana]